jgi:hypothetical protein
MAEGASTQHRQSGATCARVMGQLRLRQRFKPATGSRCSVRMEARANGERWRVLRVREK